MSTPIVPLIETLPPLALTSTPIVPLIVALPALAVASTPVWPEAVTLAASALTSTLPAVLWTRTAPGSPSRRCHRGSAE